MFFLGLGLTVAEINKVRKQLENKKCKVCKQGRDDIEWR